MLIQQKAFVILCIGGQNSVVSGQTRPGMIDKMHLDNYLPEKDLGNSDIDYYVEALTV